MTAATPIAGAPDFTWGELTGWNKASGAELERGARLVATVLQPIRTAFGRPVIVSSGGWLYSRWGFRRAKTHGVGAALDFNVQGVDPLKVWAWAGKNLRGRYGELIEERDHVHATLPGFGGDGEFLREPSEGVYVAYNPNDPSTPLGLVDKQPVEIPGLTVTVAGGPTGWWWGFGIAIAILAATRNKGRTNG